MAYSVRLSLVLRSMAPKDRVGSE